MVEGFLRREGSEGSIGAGECQTLFICGGKTSGGWRAKILGHTSQDDNKARRRKGGSDGEESIVFEVPRGHLAVPGQQR